MYIHVGVGRYGGTFNYLVIHFFSSSSLSAHVDIRLWSNQITLLFVFSCDSFSLLCASTHWSMETISKQHMGDWRVRCQALIAAPHKNVK